jgi:hypothetical protein
MLPMPDYLHAAVQGAARRCKRYGVDFARTEAEETVNLAYRLIETRGLTSARASELFLEQVAVAASIRQVMGEPRLSELELMDYLNASRLFLNSWWHE